MDPRPKGPHPVILSHAFCADGDSAATQRRSGASSRSIRGQSQVVGIMPPDFRFLDMTPQPDVIVAVRLDPAAQAIGNFSFHALARLKPGVTPAEAQRRPRAYVADLARRVAAHSGLQRDARERSRTGESPRSFGL